MQYVDPGRAHRRGTRDRGGRRPPASGADGHDRTVAWRSRATWRTVGSIDRAGALIACARRPQRPSAEPTTARRSSGRCSMEAIWTPRRSARSSPAGTEITTFHLRWGEDYAMAASPDRATHLLDRALGGRPRRVGWTGLARVGELIVEHLQEGGDLDPERRAGPGRHAAGAADCSIRAPLDVTAAVGDRLDPSSPSRRKLRRFGEGPDDRLGRRGAVRHGVSIAAGLRYAFTPVGLVAARARRRRQASAAFVATVVSHRFELVLRQPPGGDRDPDRAWRSSSPSSTSSAHALVLIRYDRRVLSAGFFIFFGSPGLLRRSNGRA